MVIKTPNYVEELRKKILQIKLSAVIGNVFYVIFWSLTLFQENMRCREGFKGQFQINKGFLGEKGLENIISMGVFCFNCSPLFCNGSLNEQLPIVPSTLIRLCFSSSSRFQSLQRYQMRI